MKWDGQAYQDYIKRGLISLLTETEKEQACKMKHNDFTSLFRTQHSGTMLPLAPECTGQQSIVISCLFDRVKFDFQRPLNNLGDTTIYLTWSMAARNVRYWLIEEHSAKKERNDNMAAAFNLGTMLSNPAIEESRIIQIPCDMLIPYHNHKFELYSGERLDDMIESIKSNGVLIPIIVQPFGSQYEILIGHNRWNASKLAGKDTVPAIVKEGLSDEEAEMYVIESNLMQRGFDNLKISEQAAVIALRHAQMFSQGKRNDIIRELKLLENPELAEKEQSIPADTNKEIGEEYGMSRATIARLIRIDKLADEIKTFVDNGILPVRAGVELSYTDEATQENITRILGDYKIDIKSAHQIRAYYEENSASLSENDIIVLLTSPKPTLPKPKSVKISNDIYTKYFGNDYKSDEISTIIESALKMYFENRGD